MTTDLVLMCFENINLMINKFNNKFVKVYLTFLLCDFGKYLHRDIYKGQMYCEIAIIALGSIEYRPTVMGM